MTPLSRSPLSPRQRSTLAYLVACGERVPTMREIAAHFGTSKVTAHEHVGQLERKGYIRRDKHKSRSIVVIGDVPSVPVTLLERCATALDQLGIRSEQARALSAELRAAMNGGGR
jgi:DNA-binding GntR family transcriptional regulator